VGQWDKLPPGDGPEEPIPPASMGAPQYPEAEQPTLNPPEPHQEE